MWEDYLFIYLFFYPIVLGPDFMLTVLLILMSDVNVLSYLWLCIFLIAMWSHVGTSPSIKSCNEDSKEIQQRLTTV